jgi:F0F1-type ATP synthase membrane subunit b/b'
MRHALDALREAEQARGQYSAWASEDAYAAQRERDEGNHHRANMLDNRSREYRRLADTEKQRADRYANRIMAQFTGVQARSFHSVYQPTEYKAAAE